MSTLPSLARTFHALGDESRLRVLAVLILAGDAAVKEIVAVTGQSQPNVSGHLAKLLRADLVSVRRQGKFRVYRATVPPFLRDLVEGVIRPQAARA